MPVNVRFYSGGDLLVKYENQGYHGDIRGFGAELAERLDDTVPPINVTYIINKIVSELNLSICTTIDPEYHLFEVYFGNMTHDVYISMESGNFSKTNRGVVITKISPHEFLSLFEKRPRGYTKVINDEIEKIEEIILSKKSIDLWIYHGFRNCKLTIDKIFTNKAVAIAYFKKEIGEELDEDEYKKDAFGIVYDNETAHRVEKYMFQLT